MQGTVFSISPIVSGFSTDSPFFVQCVFVCVVLEHMALSLFVLAMCSSLLPLYCVLSFMSLLVRCLLCDMFPVCLPVLMVKHCSCSSCVFDLVSSSSESFCFFTSSIVLLSFCLCASESFVFFLSWLYFYSKFSFPVSKFLVLCKFVLLFYFLIASSCHFIPSFLFGSLVIVLYFSFILPLVLFIYSLVPCLFILSLVLFIVSLVFSLALPCVLSFPGHCF